MEKFACKENAEFLDTLNNLGKDWEELKHKNCIDHKVKVFYKIGEDGRIQTIVQMDVPWDVVTLSALFLEPDLIPVWMDQNPEFIKKMEKLREPTPLTVGIAFLVPLKWPMWDRWMIMQSITFLDPLTGGIFNVSNSIDPKAQSWFEAAVPEQPEKSVAVKANRIWKYIEATKDPKICKYVQMSDVEMGLDMVPDKLINYVIKEKTVKDIKLIRSMFAKAMPHYEKRVQEKPELYSRVRDKLGLNEE